VDLHMKEVTERLADQGLEVRLTEEGRGWLAREGFDPQFGARPLRRALQRHVESPLSVRLLRGDFKTGDLVVVDVGEDGLEFERREEWKELSEQMATSAMQEEEVEVEV